MADWAYCQDLLLSIAPGNPVQLIPQVWLASTMFCRSHCLLPTSLKLRLCSMSFMCPHLAWLSSEFSRPLAALSFAVVRSDELRNYGWVPGHDFWMTAGTAHGRITQNTGSWQPPCIVPARNLRSRENIRIMRFDNGNMHVLCDFSFSRNKLFLDSETTYFPYISPFPGC